jgi:glucokinase
MTYAIGIDIGGTKTAIGLVTDKGQLVEKQILKTDGSVPPEVMIDRMCEAVKEILINNELSATYLTGIGIGAPGPLDVTKGEITNPPNLPAWLDTPLIERVKAHFPEKCIRLENDANAAAVAEKWVGAAQNAKTFVYMTISTGIGGGFYANGRSVFGFRGNGGEVGHIVIDSNGPLCTCGLRGCFEAVASGTAIAELGSKIKGQTLTTKDVFALYEVGDAEMTNFVNDVFEKIGIGCVSMINLFDPEIIILGGGVTNVGQPLFDAVKAYTEKFALNPAGRDTPIVPSGLGQDTGVIGAAALILAD